MARLGLLFLFVFFVRSASTATTAVTGSPGVHTEIRGSKLTGKLGCMNLQGRPSVHADLDEIRGKELTGKTNAHADLDEYN